MEASRRNANSIFKALLLGIGVLSVALPVVAVPLSKIDRVEWCKGQSTASWINAIVQLERYKNAEDFEFVKKVALTEIGGMKNLSRVSRFSAVSYIQNFSADHAVALDNYFKDAETKGISRADLAKTMKQDVERLMVQKYESCIKELAVAFELPR